MTEQRFAALISILGVILTAASVIASYYQYQAADLQARAAIVALMPQIQVRAEIEKVDSDKYTDQRLVISSDGGPVYNFNSERLTWFEIQKDQKPILSQPLIGYFFAVYPTGLIKGELETITGHRNNSKYISMLENIESSLGPGFYVSRPKTIMRLSYTDSLENKKLGYFLINGGSSYRLEAENGEDIWLNVKNMERNRKPIDIDTMGQHDVFETWIGEIRQQLRL